MSPATLTPPSVELSPRNAASDSAPPRLPQPVPLRRARTPGGGPRVTRSAVAVSLAFHAVLAVVLILGIDQVQRHADDVRVTITDGDQATYLDIAQWPGSAPGAAPGQASATTAAQAVTAAAIDSVLARLPRPAFPGRVPDRLPPVPGNGGPGARPAVPGAAAAPGANGAAPGAASGNGNAIQGDVAGGRYGPGYGDRRLVVTPTAVPEREKSEHERYMDHLTQSLGEYNDSVADEAARQHRLHNWTWRDKNGREWGLGDGGVPIVAGHRLPTRIAPPIYQGRDREEAERNAARQRTEINRQAEDVDRDRNFRDRARATRARADSVRSIRRRSIPADTTGSR